MSFEGEDRRDNAWHMSKEVTVSTLLAIALAVGGGVSAYNDINSDISVIKKDLVAATDDRIRKGEVNQMFLNKDIQIQAVQSDVQKLHQQTEKIEGKIDKQNELLLEIIRTMPRKEQ